MAPSVLRAKNLRFMIYPKDHDPPHIYVIGPGAEAKFSLLDSRCLYSRGFTARALAEISSYVAEKEKYLLEKWHEIQEEQ